MTEQQITGLRASDADRHDVADALEQHYAEGRLTLDERDERVAAANEAATRDQLAALLVDLPTEQEDQPEEVDHQVDVLLIVLLCVSPPAALVYWLCTRR